MSRLLDALLTSDPVQRQRLWQAGLAMLLLSAGVAGMHYFVWIGAARLWPVLAWSALTLAGMAVFFVRRPSAAPSARARASGGRCRCG